MVVVRHFNFFRTLSVWVVVAYLLTPSPSYALELETNNPRQESRISGFLSSVGQYASEAQNQISNSLQAAKSKILDFFGKGESPNNPVVERSQLTPENAQREIASTGVTVAPNGAHQFQALKVDGKADGDTQLDSQTIMMNFKDKQVYQVASPGRPGDATLPKAKSGVPVFSLYQEVPPVKTKRGIKKLPALKVSAIPALDIGEESELKASDWFLPGVDLPKYVAVRYQELGSPDVITDSEVKTQVAARTEPAKRAERVDVPVLRDEDVVTIERVQAVRFAINQDKKFDIAAVNSLSPEDLQALRTMIITEKPQMCSVATGLLNELTKASSPEYRSYATFGLALCLHDLKLYSESVHRLLEVIAKGKREYQIKAMNRLLGNLPQEYDVAAGNVLKELKDLSILAPELKDKFYYTLTKAAVKQDNYKEAETYAALVTPTSEFYPQTQYLWGVAEYSLGKVQASLDRQRNLDEMLTQRKDETTLSALVALNLARTAFQKKQFEDAIRFFAKIKKDNPLWIQALTEQGWAQLLNEDLSGAIGNMYSIHAPYFVSVYKPESYVVQTIGYLNLCQYGDAYRTLTQLESTYRPYFEVMKSHKVGGDQIYQSVVKYLKSPSNTTVDGLPAPVLREIARHKDYLNLQSALNGRFDEVSEYAQLNGRIDREKAQSQKRLARSKEQVGVLTSRLSHAQKNPELFPMVGQMKADLAFQQDSTEFYDFESGVFEEGRAGLDNFKTVARLRLDNNIADLKQKAGQALRARLTQLTAELSNVLENNELLRYEVFAGSGENIRFHMAGGAAGERRVPASAKPQSKDLQWDFDGEYWEDEIGHYRSSIKNNCPLKEISSQAGNREQ